MADINIANLPDSPLPILDGDYIHTSQSGADYKITMVDLADRFNLVDIFGLAQTTTPASGNFLPISTSGVLSGNRSVSLFNMGKLYQANEFFVSAGSIALTDETIWRDGGIETLEQTTFQEVRDLTLDMNDGFDAHVSPISNDRYMVYDSVGSEAKFITNFSLAIEMNDPSNFSNLAVLDDADEFILRENSPDQPRSATLGTLKTYIAASVDTSNFVTKTLAETISGAKTFTNGAGVKTDKIVESTSNLGVTIDGVTLKDNNISQVVNVVASGYVTGKFRGTGGNSTNYLNILSTSATKHLTAASSGFGSTTTVIGNYGQVLTDEGLIPDNDNDQVLGAANKRWTNMCAVVGYLNILAMPLASAGGIARLPSALYCDDTLMTTGTGGSVKINSSRLPLSSTSAAGIIESTLNSEVRSGTSTTKAVTPGSIANSITSSSSSDANYTVTGGNMKLGDFIINYGVIRRDTSNNGGWTYTINFNSFGFFESYSGTDTYTILAYPLDGDDSFQTMIMTNKSSTGATLNATQGGIFKLDTVQFIAIGK